MEYSELKLLVKITQVSGVLCLVFGAIAYFYEESQYWGYLVTYPYRVYAFPLIALGIILLFISALVHDYADKKREAVNVC